MIFILACWLGVRAARMGKLMISSLACWVGSRSARMGKLMTSILTCWVEIRSALLRGMDSHPTREGLGRVLVLGGPFYTPQFLSHFLSNIDIPGKKCLWQLRQAIFVFGILI